MTLDSDVRTQSSPRAASSSPMSTDRTEHVEEVSTVAGDPDSAAAAENSTASGGVRKRIVAYGILPGFSLILAIGAGYLKWQDSSVQESRAAGLQSVTAAKDGAIALLSYKPDSVEKDLTAARDRLTGSFRDSYWQLVHDVVIPGAKQKSISAVATVPASASVTANESHAVALIFVDQTITMGNDAPTDTASSVRVTLDKVHEKWLISGFDPV